MLEYTMVYSLMFVRNVEFLEDDRHLPRVWTLWNLLRSAPQLHKVGERLAAP